MKADYYNVKIDNEVTLQSVDTLLRNEADCLLGNLDINSPTCKAAISQVHRACRERAEPERDHQRDGAPDQHRQRTCIGRVGFGCTTATTWAAGVTSD